MPRMKARITVGVAISLYVAVLGAACLTKLANYGYDDFDLAHHTQSLYNILHGSMDCSILGIPFLGNHFAAILYPIAPLYLLLPSPALLLLIQTAALGLGACALFRIAHRLLPVTWAVAISILYLIYPPLILMNLYEFHPVVLATPLILFAFDALQQGRFSRFIVLLAMLLACQENLALIAAAFGVYAWATGKRGRWVAVPLALGAVWFLIVVGLLMPGLNNNTIQFQRLYAHLGDSLPAVVRSLALHPLASIRASWDPAKLHFLNRLLAPVGYLSVLSPLTFVPLLPVLAQRLLSIRASETQLIYHYQAEFIPFMFVASAFGLRRLLKLRARAVQPLLAVLLIVMPALALVLMKPVPALHAAFKPNPTLPRTSVDRFTAGLLPTDTVAATFQFLPRLSGRRELHSLHHIYYGLYTLSDKAYPIPDHMDWVILNTMDRMTFQARPFYGPTHYRRLQELLANHPWNAVLNVDNIVALRRGSPPDGTAPRTVPAALLTFSPPPVTACTNIVQYRDADIRLIAFDLAPPQSHTAEGHMLTLYWEKTANTGGDYDALVTLTDSQGVVRQTELAPGSRFYPPQSWPVNAAVADVHGLTLNREPAGTDPITLHVDLFRLNP